MNPPVQPDITILPLTPERWPDFEDLFGPRGACGGCWCMFWGLPRKDFMSTRGDVNRMLQKQNVDSGLTPGLLAFIDQVPVGWCAVAPRQEIPGLARSRILKPVDDQPVWSVTCFFVHKDHRRQGVTIALLKGCIGFVAASGGVIIEGYPVEARQENEVPVFVYTGLASAFRQAGFSEVARRSEKRPIMRYTIEADLTHPDAVPGK